MPSLTTTESFASVCSELLLFQVRIPLACITGRKAPGAIFVVRRSAICKILRNPNIVVLFQCQSDYLLKRNNLILRTGEIKMWIKMNTDNSLLSFINQFPLFRSFFTEINVFPLT